MQFGELFECYFAQVRDFEKFRANQRISSRLAEADSLPLCIWFEIHGPTLVELRQKSSLRAGWSISLGQMKPQSAQVCLAS
jgi:hypothetical protein